MLYLNDIEVNVFGHRFLAHRSRKAHKVSLLDGHDPASVRRPSAAVSSSSTLFKDLLL